MRKSIVGLVIACSFHLAFAQDFPKSYSLPPDSHIVILARLTKTANIKLTGYQGKEVEVSAVKKGPDRDSIDIKINSFGYKLEILCGQKFGQDDASIDLEIRVPQDVRYFFDRVANNGGKIEISNIQGWMRIQSVLGNVEVKNIKGSLDVYSNTGSVSVDIDQIFGFNRIFSSSGSVAVRAPAKLDASIEMRSDVGQIKTDFPIEIREDRFGAKFAAQWLGYEKPKLQMGSIHGQVSLMHK